MKKITFVLLATLLTGCYNNLKPIAYGNEGCHYCSMTIVDKQHAAQFITKKGRSYAFDATECMLNHLKKIEASTVEQILVNDYNAPGETIEASKATYLISKNIPSPMGEFLTAFRTKEEAKLAKNENAGELFTWNEMINRFKK